MRTVEITYRYDGDNLTPREHPTDADSARRRMDEGNRAFADLFANLETGAGTARRIIPVNPRDIGLLSEGGKSLQQRPYAAVLGCADARVPIELIFNEGPNDLFVVRVAGNTIGDGVRGSLRYALDQLGDSLKLIVVLGHSSCGAVSAAVDVFLEPAGYLSIASRQSVRTLVDRLQVVVLASAKRMDALLGSGISRHPNYRAALIEVAGVTNAALAAHTLQWEIGGKAADGVRTAYGVYLLTERMVWAPRCGSNEVLGLAAPPVDAEAFDEFSKAVMRTDRIAKLLS